jgi:hypothetical protein
MKKLFCFFFIFYTHAHADLASKLSSYVGYTIIKVGHITGWQDENGKKGDSFEGCEYGRRLFIDYTLQVTCSTYRYHYAYRPQAVFLSNQSRIVMILDDEDYDVR